MKRFTQSILWISGFLCLLSALLFLWITQTGDVAPMPEQHVGQAAVGTHANPAMPDNNAAGENPSLITGSSRPGLVSQVDKAIPVVQPAPSPDSKADESVEARIAELLRQAQNMSDPVKRADLVSQVRVLETGGLQAAQAKAVRLGLPIRGAKPEGGHFELVGFDGDRPLYQETKNVNAAISTGANLVRSVAPFNVDGTGLTFGLWEVGGIPRRTHQEFGSPSRVTARDSNSTITEHASHVAGTLAAAGVNASLLGMAPGARVDAYDAVSDTSEMLAAGAAVPGEAGKIYVSNHSYGLILGWHGTAWTGDFTDNGNQADDIEPYFGRYDFSSASLDSMLVSLPYYLPFMSSGNDRNDAPPAAGGTWTFGSTNYNYDPDEHPLGDGMYKNGYDTMDAEKASKNVMTVGAAEDAVVAGARNLAAGVISSFSSTGPADDGRIKPDIVANGVNLLSVGPDSDTDTAVSSGTSMSSPNAAGSALLLVDYYHERFATYMRASTLKGLIIHTADDIGRPGPDYFYGWGLMDTKEAADHIKRHADEDGYQGMIEADLTNAAPSDVHSFIWDGSSPIRVTLCWTDPAGSGVSAHDNRTRDLVNDLNLTVTGPAATTHRPFVMPYVGNWTNAMLSANATTGVNTVDNVEQVLIQTPPAVGVYTVTVNHAGSLSGGQQRYSLIISGQATDDMDLDPTQNFVASGQQGGPLAPLTMDYVVTNSSATTAFNWTGSSNAAWVTLSTPGGNLPATETAIVTASLTSAVNSLPVGTHSATLTFTNTTSGFVTTRQVTLNIAAQTFPSIQSPPQPLTVDVGDSASFSVSATGGGLTYQWQKGTTDISGATESTYSILTTTADSAGTYRCIVTNGIGSANSIAALLTVITPPEITQSPLSQTVPLGQEVMFSVTASGMNLEYQWQKDETDLTGRREPTLTLTNVNTLSNGGYRCIVSNSAGSVPSEVATLSVDGPPNVKQQPGDVLVNVNQPVTLSVTAVGPGLSYQWQKNTINIDTAAATSATFQIPAASVADSGSYRCRISNTHGTISSNTVTLTVIAPPVVTSPVVPSAITINQGAPLNLAAAVDGLMLSFQWHKDLAPLSGATASTYSVNSAQGGNSGVYSCLVTNPAGQAASADVTVLVVTPPVIVTEPQDTQVDEGEPVVLSVAASGPLLQYQWWHNGLPITGATGASHIVSALTPTRVGIYYCRISNSAAAVATRYALVGIEGMPLVTRAPYPSLIEAGSPLKMSVEADGNDLAYAWKLAGKQVGVGSNYEVWPVTSKNGGLYTAQVSNSLRTTTTQPVSVTVVSDMSPALDASTLKWSTTGPAFWRPLTGTQAFDGKDTMSVGNLPNGHFSTLSTRVTGPLIMKWRQKISTEAGSDLLKLTLDGTESASISGVHDWHESSITVPTGLHQIDFTYAKDSAGAAGQDRVWLDTFILEPATIPSGSAENRLVASGSTQSLESTYTGPVPESFQWRRNGGKIAKATTATLDLVNIQLSQAGTYDCEMTSTVNGVKMTRLSPPVEIGVVEVLHTRHVVPASTVQPLIAKAVGKNLTYQWRRGSSPINGEIFSKVSITLHQTTFSDDYICAVTNPAGTVDAGIRRIDVFNRAPEITLAGDLDDAVLSGPYSFQVPVNPVPAFAPTGFTAKGLPKGLVIDKVTGLITGIPEQATPSAIPVTITAFNKVDSDTVETRLFVHGLGTKTGVFTGPLGRDAALNQGLGGRLDLVITANGSFSGTLTLGTLKHSFKSRIVTSTTNLTQATAIFDVARGKDTPVRVDLLLTDAGLMTGTVTQGANSLDIDGWKVPWTKAAPATAFIGTKAPLGCYNFALPMPPEPALADASSPQGTGFGTFIITRDTGIATISGRLPDDSTYTASSAVGTLGQMVVFTPIYAAPNLGSLQGQLDIAPATNPDDNTLDGQISWWRPTFTAAAKQRLDPDGFEAPVVLEADGTRYIAPDAPELVLGLTEAGPKTADSSFLHGGIGSPSPAPDITVTLGKGSTVTYPALNPRKTTLSFVPAKGTFIGSFTLEDTDPLDLRPPPAVLKKLSRKVTFNGLLVLTSDGWQGVGSFQLPELPDATGETLTTTPIHSGAVQIKPTATP
jgi:hypothetical protein